MKGITPVVCAMCNKPYVAESVELKTERNTETGLERIYYACPHCGFEYTIALTDEKIRWLMEKRQKMTLSYRKQPTAKKLARLNDLSLDIRQRMDRLNKKAEGMAP